MGLGFAAWLGTLWLVRWLKLNDAVLGTVICIGSLAAVNFVLDAVFSKVQLSQSAGLDWRAPDYSWQRTGIKFLGMVASFGFIGLLYWLFPEYQFTFHGSLPWLFVDHTGDFYGYYVHFLRWFVPCWLVVSVPYIYFVDARQKDPQDGYYAAGMAVTFQFEKVGWRVLWQHCLGWLVKGYFLALMFTYYARDTRNFINYYFGAIRDFRSFYDFSYYFIFLADTAVACVGYLLTLRIFDTHIRRTEPTFLGWAVALVCYQPFWSWISGSYLDYSKDFAWGSWLEHYPVVYAIWGSAILGLLGVYLWATIMFGCRFSNLTHRGILTNGPYRWTKHPAYIAKNLSYWLTYIPFIVSQSVADSVRRCLLLGLLNYVYYLRAKTEEANLSTDPVYVQYANWMRENGIFRWVRRRE